MNFQSLPNEILIECFEYLNAFEIFYSFDQLNYRFNKLIRTISLYLSFENVRRSIFDQFCLTIKTNPEIQNQIYSLKLSNKDTCGQIELFLSLFSLNDFANLRSLTLVDVNEDNVIKLESMLPLLSELYTFHATYYRYEDEILLPLLISKLKTLSIRRVQPFLMLHNKISSIINLTVCSSLLNELLEIFKYVPMLKYLHVDYVDINSKLQNNICYCDTVHLKHLIFDRLQCKFESLGIFLKHTPNLTHLTISVYNNNDFIDADRWEYLIRSSLVYLKNFTFVFECYSPTENNIIIKKFQQFQTNFWQVEHHWYTEYILDTNSGVIYTIPYLSKTYELKSNIERYSNKFPNNFNTFDNITDLMLPSDALKKKCSYYFSNVKSLTIIDDDWLKKSEDRSLTMKHIEYLQTIINLSNIKKINFPVQYGITTSNVLLEILKQTPQLSSILIDLSKLISFVDDKELCKYLNKMIKKFDSHRSSYPFDNSNELTKFCQIFSNLEQLTCKINQFDHCLYILNHLSKLSILKVYGILLDDQQSNFDRFKNEAKKRNIMFRIEHNFFHGNIMQIWTG